MHLLLRALEHYLIQISVLRLQDKENDAAQTEGRTRRNEQLAGAVHLLGEAHVVPLWVVALALVVAHFLVE